MKTEKKDSIIVFYCNIGDLKPATKIDKYIDGVMKKTFKPLLNKFKNAEGVIIPIRSGESRIEIIRVN